MKIADKLEPELKLDPRIKDVIKFNRIRDLVDNEILHQAWGCKLWRLERLGKITAEQRKAGDAYCKCVEDYRIALYSTGNTEDKKRYKDAVGLLSQGRDGLAIRRAIDELCLEELAAVTERQLQLVRWGLTRLSHFFALGNKS